MSRLALYLLFSFIVIACNRNISTTGKTNERMITFERYAGYFDNNADKVLQQQFYNNLAKDYNSEGRYYHNLTHIDALLKLSDQYATKLQQKDVVDLAIIYHDIIYDAARRDNEEQSAERAVLELAQLQVSKEKIELIRDYILATKGHHVPADATENDKAYMLDFDLSILGADWNTYEIYTKNIRKEYQMIPDSLFMPGRVRVLQSFLDKTHIFHTKTMREQLEASARQNLEQEIQLLKK